MYYANIMTGLARVLLFTKMLRGKKLGTNSKTIQG